MADPDFLAQNGDPMTTDEARVWWETRCDEFEAQGARFFQISFHQTIRPRLWLVEAWKERQEDYGEPRFQLTAVTATEGKNQ